MLGLLDEYDSVFACSIPDGKPAQLEWLIEGYSELKKNSTKVERLLAQGPMSNTLQQRWDTVVARYDAIMHNCKMLLIERAPKTVVEEPT
jgi:hypothetical protein